MKTDTLGLYIHIPFCERKCNYCDFNSSAQPDEIKMAYVKKLIEEIKKDSYFASERIVDTIFIGGGTPSVLSADCIFDIVDALYKNFNISNDIEFTIEANPNSLDYDKLCHYKKFGINRISIGAQSFFDDELAKLGRLHNSEDIYRAVYFAREAGFQNINIDLMFGIPNQTISSFEKSLADAVSLNLEHISCYNLILEEGTPFYEKIKKGENLNLPGEDIEIEMYKNLLSDLAKNGYKHYEVSNFSKRGYECRHNLKYWKIFDYLGFGLGSHSKLGNIRYENEVDLSKYLKNEKNRNIIEVLTASDEITERIIMGLRLAEGFNYREIEDEFGIDFLLKYKSAIEKNLEKNFIEMDEECIKATPDGLKFLNRVELDFYSI